MILNECKLFSYIACVASVSLRGSSRKLGKEQKKMNDGGGGGERRNRLPANAPILKNRVRPRTQLLIAAVRVVLKLADFFTSQGYSFKKKTRWSDDKTIIELGYLKISWLVSVSQINCLSLRLRQMIYWSARHRQSRYFAQPRPIIVNYFSKIKLVSQKYRDKTTLVSKTLFGRHCFGFQSWRFSLLKWAVTYSLVVAQPVRMQHW